MQMQSTYWLEKVLKMISFYGNALSCTLQHIVIHAMQISGVNSEKCQFGELTPLRSFSARSLISRYFAFAFV